MKIIIFICILFLSGCTSAYHAHFFRENPDYQETAITLSGEEFHSDGGLVSLPDQKILGSLITAIQSAKDRIWIEMYTWTDAAKLTDPIIEAHKRGVEVRVVLEGNVFGTPRINAPVAKKLKDAGIEVVYADNQRYAFTHAKFWIIDTAYSISTGNWTASFFTKNREYLYTGHDSLTRSFLEAIFEADSRHQGYKNSAMIPAHMVLSPLNARLRLEDLITSTQEHLRIYVQTLDDAHILSLLEVLARDKKDIEICTADNETNQSNRAKYPLWHWKTIRKPYLHAKVIVVDHAKIYIGSHNLTQNSIENNREMGIIIPKRDDMVQQIDRNFSLDGCR